MAYYKQEPLRASSSDGKGNSNSSNNKQFAVILVNLGTPDAATAKSIRRYLAEFLSDRRIIEAPRWLWYPILYGIILNTRPKKVAKAYAEIWTENGSPLLDYSLQLSQALNSQFDDHVTVTTAMRYGNPSLESVLDQLKHKNINKVLFLPLFPQYSASTTASIVDKISSIFTRWRVIPDYRIITNYCFDDAYINALVQQITNHWAQNGKADKLLFSFHGLPQQYIDAGDVYQSQCIDTATRVAKILELNKNDWVCCFQSRFGPKQWIQPYTDETLKQLPEQNIQSVDVICPGFAVDCLETIEEINIQNRDLYLQAGGKQFHYIPALNNSAEHIQLMRHLIEKNCTDWLHELSN